jgi:hypothetical protein
MSALRGRQASCTMVPVALALVLGLIATGCYFGPAGVGVGAEFEVGSPPPPVRDDVVIAQPGPGFVWIGGYWDWDVAHRTYAWRAGRWERPPHGGAVWEASHYEFRQGHHYFRTGHWRTAERR